MVGMIWPRPWRLRRTLAEGVDQDVRQEHYLRKSVWDWWRKSEDVLRYKKNSPVSCSKWQWIEFPFTTHAFKKDYRIVCEFIQIEFNRARLLEMHFDEQWKCFLLRFIPGKDLTNLLLQKEQTGNVLVSIHDRLSILTLYGFCKLATSPSSLNPWRIYFSKEKWESNLQVTKLWGRAWAT